MLTTTNMTVMMIMTLDQQYLGQVNKKLKKKKLYPRYQKNHGKKIMTQAKMANQTLRRTIKHVLLKLFTVLIMLYGWAISIIVWILAKAAH